MGNKIIKDTYLNIEKFEYNVSNEGIKLQKIIDRRKRLRIFDIIIKILIQLICVAIFTFLILILVEFAFSVKNDYNIKNMQSILDTKSNNYKKIISNAYDENKMEKIKQLAYLEYNMITPTDKNIIYFDKDIAINGYK